MHVAPAFLMAIEFKDTIRFEPVKEDRGPYFVEYHVPNDGVWFANVFLVFHQPASTQEVVTSMETELARWLRRYSVPVMVTAFDEVENVKRIRPLREDDMVIGWIDASGAIASQWKTSTPDGAPIQPYTKDRLIETYPDMPHRISTVADKQKWLRDTARRNRLLRNVVITWFVAIPVAIAIFTQFVEWAGWVATGLSVLAGFWKLAEIMGWRQKSKQQQEVDAVQLRMKHHHYYCERNPEGFNRLKVDVLNREFRERILKEADELKRKQ